MTIRLSRPTTRLLICNSVMFLITTAMSDNWGAKNRASTNPIDDDASVGPRSDEVFLKNPTESKDSVARSSKEKAEDIALLEEWKKIVARWPVVETKIHRMMVYKNGIVTRVTIYNRTKAGIQISLLHESLSLRGLDFIDRKGCAWHLPALKNHYLFSQRYKEDTVLIEPGKSIDVELIDILERPTLKQSSDCQILKDIPNVLFLQYDLKWLSSMTQSRAGQPSIDVRRLAKGVVKTVWMEQNIPINIHSRIINGEN